MVPPEQDPFEQPDITYEPVFVARQAIFDRSHTLWGYELLFRHGGQAQTAQIFDPDVATAKVIADGFSMAMDNVDAQTRVLINFPRNLLLKDSAFALPKETCVVEILETVKPEPDVLDACQRLKEAGYTLALDDFVGQPGYEPLIELADLIKVEVLNQSPPELIKLTQRLMRHGRLLLAEKVEDQKMYDLCKALGYNYFQGYFFSKPQILPGRKLSSNALSKVKLLQELAKEDYHIKELSSVISSDISLSYRLLKYLNTAAFSFREKVTSITHAVTILGRLPLKQWLMVSILSDLDNTPRAAELAFSSVQRGRFMELAARELPSPPYSGETMFLLGLFSRLDAMLGMTMAEVVDHMPLEEDIKQALRGEQGSHASVWLDMVAALDGGNWTRGGQLIGMLSLDFQQVAVCHAKASAWAHEILGLSKAQ